MITITTTDIANLYNRLSGAQDIMFALKEVLNNDKDSFTFFANSKMAADTLNDLMVSDEGKELVLSVLSRPGMVMTLVSNGQIDKVKSMLDKMDIAECVRVASARDAVTALFIADSEYTINMFNKMDTAQCVNVLSYSDAFYGFVWNVNSNGFNKVNKIMKDKKFTMDDIVSVLSSENAVHGLLNICDNDEYSNIAKSERMNFLLRVMNIYSIFDMNKCVDILSKPKALSSLVNMGKEDFVMNIISKMNIEQQAQIFVENNHADIAFNAENKLLVNAIMENIRVWKSAQNNVGPTLPDYKVS